jgi:predicted O-methyltransferase YrrM
MSRVTRFLQHDILQGRLRARLAYWNLRRRYGTNIPIEKIAPLRSLTSMKDGFDKLIRGAYRAQTGAGLANHALAQAMQKMQVGAASLNTEALNFLEAELKQKKATLIAEFGSGLSTVCLAYFMHEMHPNNEAVMVISFEQSLDYAAQTEALLKKFGLEAYARVVVAPLAEIELDAEKTVSYNIEPLLDALFSTKKADWILIDGPAHEDWLTRYAPLVLLAPYAPKDAAFYLDDAAREREMDNALRWSKLPNIAKVMYHPFGEGIVSGVLK